MSSTRALFCGVLALGIVLTTLPAEARFGKRSSSEESKDDDNGPYFGLGLTF